MMNMRDKLTIFPHPQQFTLDPPPGGGDWSEAPRRLRRPVKKNTHLDATLHNWSASESPNYAQELNQHRGTSHFLVVHYEC